MENFKSGEYWESRYTNGQDSGWGSHNQTIVNFKKDYVNNILKNRAIDTVVELGCGDGNQLNYFEGYKTYYGYDVSHNIITKCSLMYVGHENKKFVYNVEELLTRKYDLALSLDVTYHLVEDDVFREYLKNLFTLSDLVCIFSTNDENNDDAPPHIKNRKISDYVSEHYPEFILVDSKKYYEHDTNTVGFFLYSKIV